MSNVIYVIRKSQASHSDDDTCVVFVAVAGTSVLWSPCLPHGQDIRSSPMILSLLVAENLWVCYRCHLNVPSSVLAPSLGFKGTEQTFPSSERSRLGFVSQVIRATMCSFAVPLLLFWPLQLLAVTWPPGHCPCCCPHCAGSPLGFLHLRHPWGWDYPADHAQTAPETTDLHTAHGSCSHSSSLRLTHQHHRFSSPPLTREVLSALPDWIFQEAFLPQSCGASKDKFSIPHPSFLQRPQVFWGWRWLVPGCACEDINPHSEPKSQSFLLSWPHLTSLKGISLQRFNFHFL